MDAAEIRRDRDALIEQWGAWVAYNIHLGCGVYTMSNDEVGTPEFLVNAIVQGVADLAAKPVDQLRVLDLGCHEGGYAIEFGLQGATVVGVEGRRNNIEKARFSSDVLGLDRVEFVEGDVRDEGLIAGLGRFDVVLCLGIIYHLEFSESVKLIERCHSLCDRLTVIRSAIGLTPNTTMSVGAHLYRGRRYSEDIVQRGASLDNPLSVMPTRATLLNLLTDIGFTSVFEMRNPVVPSFEDAVDSVTFMALKGNGLSTRSCPMIDEVVPQWRSERRGPAWMRAYAHPQQGLYWKGRERLFHTFSRTVFGSRRSIERWRSRRL